MKSRKAKALDLVRTCCHVLEEKKAGDLRVLEIGELSSITDYLILATATSDPHLRALRVELEKTLKENAVRVVGVESAQESGWTIIDLFDVMIHLFRADMRAHYGLENLWKDASEIRVSQDTSEKVGRRTHKKKPAKSGKRQASSRK